jgi:hypothetical protein
MKACAALLLAASIAPAALINGDFETGDFSAWTVTAFHGVANEAIETFDVTGAGESSAARFQTGRSGSPFGPAGGVVLSQFFLLEFDDFYSVSASVAAWLPDSIPAVRNAHAGTFELLLDSAVLDKVAFGSIGSGQLFQDELRYEGSLGSGPHELSIRIRRDFAASETTPLQFVDDIAIAPIGGAIASAYLMSEAFGFAAAMAVPTPEPSAGILIGSALAAWLLMLRRRLR